MRIFLALIFLCINSFADSPKKITYSLSYHELTTQLDHFGDLLQQARAIKVTENSKVKGYQLVEIQPGSLLTKMHIVNRDIILKLDGKRPTNVIHELQDLQAIKAKTKKSLEVLIERSGKELIFHYDIH